MNETRDSYEGGKQRPISEGPVVVDVKRLAMEDPRRLEQARRSIQTFGLSKDDADTLIGEGVLNRKERRRRGLRNSRRGR